MRFIAASCVLALAISSAGSAWGQDKKARQQSANNLKAIGKAVLEYTGISLDPNAKPRVDPLPAHAIYSKDGKTPLLSWRVAILPYIEHEALYQQFKLDEPWDSPHNKKLLDKMPKLYAPTVNLKGVGDNMTFCQVVIGLNTMFNGPKGITFAQ